MRGWIGDGSDKLLPIRNILPKGTCPSGWGVIDRYNVRD